jgi:uncharacterized protein (TIGR03118 family)
VVAYWYSIDTAGFRDNVTLEDDRLMSQTSVRLITRGLLSALALGLLPGAALADFIQTNLVSNVSGEAAVTDPSLLNPWGVSFSATSPFWVSDNAANLATLYQGTGAPVSLVVSVPGGPTGQVFNSAGAGNFVVGSTPSSFIFATLGGSIYAWNASSGTSAQLEASTPGATFTGLALDNNGSGNFLYAANSAGGGGIDVFNSNFAAVTPSGTFVDPNLPAGFVPYNIQNINGLLYVEYKNSADPTTLGAGAVSVFDANGNFIQELIGPGGELDDPWGVVIAPSSFGSFSNDLMVGNFGNGEINAFNPTTGAFLGTLTGPGGTPLVNQDLWSLSVRAGGTFDADAVYFTAGIDNQKDGLFGEIVASPEPGSLALTGLGCFVLVLFSRRKRAPLTGS